MNDNCYLCDCPISMFNTGHLMENEEGTGYYEFCEECSDKIDEEEGLKEQK